MTTLRITPGETGSWLITVTDAGGAAQSLASLVAAWLTVKRRHADPDPGLFQLTLGDGLAVDDAGAGTLQATAASALTALLADGTPYVWDCRLKFSDGTISNPEALRGILLAEQRVTHTA